MAKKNRASPVPSLAAYEPPPDPALKKQSRWSGDKWKPGEVPNTPLRTVHSGPDGRTAYGEYLGVRPPIGRGYLPESVPGKDTK